MSCIYSHIHRTGIHWIHILRSVEPRVELCFTASATAPHQSQLDQARNNTHAPTSSTIRLALYTISPSTFPSMRSLSSKRHWRRDRSHDRHLGPPDEPLGDPALPEEPLSVPPRWTMKGGSEDC